MARRIDPRHERERMKKGGDIVRDEARAISGRFSRRIPAATRTRQGPRYTEVVTDGREAPNAAPFELAEEHPLFGNKKHNYRQPHRPYLAQAVDATVDAVAEEISKLVDDWANDLGYTEE